MKILLLFATLLVLPVVLTAEASPAAPSRHPLPGAWRHRAVEKFDADRNGRLSQDERETAKAAFQEKARTRRAARFQRLDADSDGCISRAEWDAATVQRPGRAGAVRQRLLEKFDADKDGRLSRPERIQARGALREWFMK